MAFTNPVTWVVGQLVTAALMNEQVRDNLIAIWKGTTAGDLDYYTGADAKARLPIGDPGQVLRVAAGGASPEWGSGVIAGMVQRTSEFSTASASFVDVTSVSFTLSLPSACTVLVMASGSMRIGVAGNEAHFRAMVDGVGDGSYSMVSAYDAGDLGWKPLGYTYLKTGVGAGTRTIKAQLRTSNTDANARLARVTLVAVAFPE